MCCVILDETINQSMHHASENSQHRTGDKLWGASYEVKPVPLPQRVWWACPPKQSSKLPQIEILNVINQYNFCQLWMSNPLCTNVKPRTNVKPPYWRLSGDGSEWNHPFHKSDPVLVNVTSRSRNPYQWRSQPKNLGAGQNVWF